MAASSSEADGAGVELETPLQIQQKLNLKRKNPSSEVRKTKAKFLARRKPSYCLKRGVGNFLIGEGTIRSQNRQRLLRLLQEYMIRQMWKEACAVLSVLQQATVTDSSSSLNRAKFKGVLQLLCHTNRTSFEEIRKIYDLWCKRLSPTATKERLLVQSESIIHFLQLGQINGARQAALGLMQEEGFETNPYANWVVGIVFCRLLYSGIPDELQLREMDSAFDHTQPEVPPDFICASNNLSVQETDSPHSNDESRTSVAFGKENEDKYIQDNEPRDGNSKEAISRMNAEQLTVSSAGPDRQSPDYESGIPHASVLSTQGLPLWLLPIKLPSSDEDMESARCIQGQLHIDYYKSALKHLRAAVYLEPPIFDAFLPLIQLLLLGDQVDEALEEVEKICNTSASKNQLRIKACLLEYFDGGKHAELRECYENILKKKPRCSYTLERLINMHQGIYDTTDLVKMIALHLDAAPGACTAWHSLAECFLKLSECEADTASACCNNDIDSHSKIPDMFTAPPSWKVWRVRARWWLDRHFNPKNLHKDATSDDLRMLTYKAAAASYIYGRRFFYVTSAIERLEEKDNMELYSFLQKHALNAVGFYSSKTIGFQ